MLSQQDLKNIENNLLFSDLTQDQISYLLSYATKINLKKDQILFHEGEVVEYIYFLLSGGLSVVLQKGEDETLIGKIEPGEVLGEIGALANKERSATIYADVDCTLLSFAKDDFLEIILKIPQILLKIATELAVRSGGLIDKIKKQRTTHIAMILNLKDEVCQEFLHRLKENIDEQLVLFNVFDYPNDSENELVKRLNKVGKKTKSLLCIFDINDKKCINTIFNAVSITKVYFVTDANKSLFLPGYFEIYEGILKDRRCSLIKIHEKSLANPGVGHSYEDYFSTFHQVSITNNAHYQSVIRYLCGKQIGLVFGGGGVKGWFHMGVLKAIEELKIPIDMIGGSSSGSIAGACYAMDANYENAIERFKTIMSHLRKPYKLSNLAIPNRLSLFTGKVGTVAIQEVFENQLIEDMMIPFYCISGNLTTYKEMVHTRGLLWQCLRASVAIPGLLPPVVIDDQMYIDGGVIDNLPVEVMRELLGRDSKIIAVSLGGNSSSKIYSFPAYLSNLELLKRMIFRKTNYVFPSFSNYLMSVLLMGAASKEIDACVSADILLKPNLKNHNVIGIKPKQEQNLVELGYLQTLCRFDHFGLSGLFTDFSFNIGKDL